MTLEEHSRFSQLGRKVVLSMLNEPTIPHATFAAAHEWLSQNERRHDHIELATALTAAIACFVATLVVTVSIIK
jgi:hypothetical protein